jgi:hypothetical protein
MYDPMRFFAALKGFSLLNLHRGLDHLPNLLHAEDIRGCADSPHSNLLRLLGEEYKEWVLRLTVQEELFRITKLTDAGHLAMAFRGICTIFRPLLCTWK